MSHINDDSKGRTSRMLNVKLPEEDYDKLKKIAHELGDVSLSSMMRLLIYDRMNRYDKSGNARDFLDAK